MFEDRRLQRLRGGGWQREGLRERSVEEVRDVVYGWFGKATRNHSVGAGSTHIQVRCRWDRGVQGGARVKLVVTWERHRVRGKVRFRHCRWRRRLHVAWSGAMSVWRAAVAGYFWAIRWVAVDSVQWLRDLASRDEYGGSARTHGDHLLGAMKGWGVAAKAQ